MNQLLTGIILETKKAKVYNHWPACSPPNCQKGCRYGKKFYKLKVKIENKLAKNISVFTDKLVQKEKVLPVLENIQFIDKRYLFRCQNHFGNYQLVDWEELTVHEKET